MDDLGTLVGVWAHPDDETYLSAGLMAAATGASRRVVCVTATRGEAGSQDEQRWPAATLASVREAELRAALGILGVREHRWLGYPDGGCDRVPPEEAIDRVARILWEIEPDTVMTFGPEGMTGHSDHRSVSAWTTAAFPRAARPGARLLYAAAPKGHVDGELERRMLELRVFDPDVVPGLDPSQLAVDFVLPPALLERKLAALAAQPSQTDVLRAHLGDDLYRHLLAREAFRAADELSAARTRQIREA
jgi:LmbE family N-acetylglucosaminyl deacetylase